MQGEILTGRERRRRWSADDKIAILKEAFAPGAVVTDVARRHDLRSQQIYQWRDAVLAERQGNIVGDLDEAGFVPVTVVPPCEQTAGPTLLIGTDSVTPTAGQIEMVVLGGRILRAPGSTSCAELKRLVRALETA